MYVKPGQGHVSLVYLAVQARQSAQMERSENYGRIVETVGQAIARISDSPEKATLVIEGSIDLGSLKMEDRVRFSLLMFEIFGNYEFVYEQSRENALPDHVWPHYLQHLQFWASMPGVRTWWNSRKAIFSEGFMKAASPEFEKTGFTPEQARAMWADF